ncbi:MAG TPA: porin [Rhizomicrobium sp.]|nr:porin [Rhizomicrobium sp.]
MRKAVRRLAAITAVWAFLVPPAMADGLTDWSLSPPEIEWDGWTASLGGLAGGSAFTATKPGEGQQAGASLSALLLPRVQRTLDNGWEIGARGAILAYHDDLAGDIYGNRTFEKGYLFAQTPYGRFEAGQNDGAASRLAVTGPSVDAAVAIDNASTTFFRDPATGEAFINVFRLRTPVFATSNDAKFTYVSPRLFGIEVAGSYTPYDAHGGLPFISRGAGGLDRQRNILEAAADYAGDLGDVSYEFYAGAAYGFDASRTPGHANLKDWGFGGEADDTLGGIKFALGGAYRQSNAYTFDIADARSSGTTRSWRASTTATMGPWIAGFEYAGGQADEALPSPGLQEHGYGVSLGYVLNSNLQLTAGWQQLQFRRDTGLFSTGAPNADLNAGFLYLRLHV